jgi:pimeloyl-ACP methyl ester carboxylesterase
MQPLVNEHVLIRGTRIAYDIYGEPTGEPIILLHGTPSSSLIWRKVLPHLTNAHYRVHVFDWLGYGLSERPWDPSIDTSISGQVPILEELLAHWGLESTHLVAHDIGGGIAQRLAIFSPQRIRSLVLVDVVSFDSYPSARTKKQMEEGLESLIRARDAEHREHYRDWLLSAVQKREQFERSSLDTFLGYISGPVGQASLYQHQVRFYNPKHTLEIADRLGELGKLPVKLIWGAKDRWQVPDWAHKLHESIPGSELEIIENSGHFSPEDQPERLAELLLTFLKEHS